MISNTPRMSRRLNYLQKNRPNSPEIAVLQQRISNKNNMIDVGSTGGAVYGATQGGVNKTFDPMGRGFVPPQAGNSQQSTTDMYTTQSSGAPTVPGETAGGGRTPYQPPNTPENNAGATPTPPTTPEPPAQQKTDFPKLTRRLRYLLKNRPNSPEIATIQAKLGITKDSPFSTNKPTGLDDKTGAINSGQVFNNAPDLAYDQDKAFGEAYNSAYNYITQDYGTQKAQEIEAAKQELANRGIPIDPTEGSLYSKTLKAIDTKYQQLDDQAKNQAFLQGGQLYGTKAGASTDAFNAFMNATRGMSALEIQKFLGELSIKNGGTPIIGGNAPGF